MRPSFLRVGALASLASLALPSAAFAQEGPDLETVAASLDTTLVIVETVLVMFMQAGFALLEIGFSRG